MRFTFMLRQTNLETNIWDEIPFGLRVILGVLATLLILPAILVYFFSQKGYLNTFFYRSEANVIKTPVNPAEQIQRISTQDFKWDSEDQRDQEWKQANSLLTPDTKSFKLRRKEPSNNITHSFMMFGNYLLAMAAKGSYLWKKDKDEDCEKVKVKLAEDQMGTSWVIKTILLEKPEPSSDAMQTEEETKEIKELKKESNIATDLKMALPLVQRTTADSKFFKIYIPYVYAGMPLLDYIKENKPTVTERFDIAINLVEVVAELHSGAQSQSGTRYAHRDLHAGNVTVDKQGKVHLIDFGCASVIQNDGDVAKDILKIILLIVKQIFTPDMQSNPAVQAFFQTFDKYFIVYPRMSLAKPQLNMKKIDTDVKDNVFPTIHLIHKLGELKAIMCPPSRTMSLCSSSR